MFETLKNAWKLPDLRKRLLYTLMIILVFRIGAALPVPFLNTGALTGFAGDGTMFGFLNIMTGGAFQNGTLFALSITPYITASIVIQLLTVAIPALEKLSKEGEDGRKKLKKIERYTTVALAVLESIGYYRLLVARSGVVEASGFASVVLSVTIVTAFTAGAMLCVWLGEKIDENGIGNGISMLLFAGIISRAPTAVIVMVEYFISGVKMLMDGQIGYGLRWVIGVPVITVLFIFVIAFIILMTKAERRIPVQYAKRVVGRKMYGGQSSHLPISVNLSGVLPVIFASSLLAIPTTIGAFVTPAEGGLMEAILKALNYDSPIYAVLYLLLIVAFAYFYVAIQYNPVEMSNNLRKNNGAIPGIRPGKPTSDFIAKIISKVTMIGAMFLGVIAILPIGVGAISGISNISIGGTTIIIVVGVALDTVRQLESEMMMRHYKGFLE